MTKLCVMIALGIVLCGVATADPGRNHYARGQTLYRDGKYREAHDAFAAGFDASQLPAFMFNMAECSRLAGNVDAARDEYSRYLALEPGGKLAPLASQRLAALPAPAPTPSPPASAAAAAPPQPPAPTPTPMPAPAAVAQRAEAVAPARPLDTPPADPAVPLWKRTSVWIAAGAITATAIALVVVTSRGDSCPATCVDWRKP